MSDNITEKAVCECCERNIYNGLPMRLTLYETCYEDHIEKLLCLNCADHLGLVERDIIFRVISSTPYEGTRIKFSELVKLCANIIPFDIKKIKGYNDQDDQDDQKVMKLSVAKYLQFMLQFYGIYLEIGLIKANIEYDMYLKLHPIPNMIRFDDNRYYHMWNPLVRWFGAEGFKYKTYQDNPFNSNYCFEYEGVNFYISPSYFREENDECCDMYTCTARELSPPLYTLNEYTDKDDILIKE